MSYRIHSPKYYDEYLRETNKQIRERDQSDVMADIVREIESHTSGLEEQERTMGHPNHFLPDEYEMETLDKIPMEDKLILSREEDYPAARELTPGEIARIVNNALRDLPDVLIEESGPEIADACQTVAYEVMSRLVSQ